MFYKGKDTLNPSLMQHVVFHKDPGNRHHSKAYFGKLQTGVETKLIVLGQLARKEAEVIDDLLEIPFVSLSGQVCLANSTYVAMFTLCRNCISGLVHPLDGSYSKRVTDILISVKSRKIHHLDI